MPFACQKPEQPLPLGQIEKDYDRPLPPGQFALRKLTDTSMYPKFGDGWYRAKGLGLREAVQHSIDYLGAPSSKKYFPIGPISHEKVVESLTLFIDVLDQANSPQALDDLIRQNFDVYISVGYDNDGTVLFTGYYSPIFDGSLTPTEQFRYPLYRLPPEIQKDENGEVVGGPWQTRQEIEQSHMLDGQEIAWVGDRFEAYVVTVQGSGFIRLPDGTLHEIGYSGHNGHEYTPIGRMLVADGKIDRHRLSLAAMIRHFKQYPQDLDQYLYQNKRYVFFQDSKGGPYGCLGKPVTSFHSLATDKDIFPRAALTFLDTRIPQESGSKMQTYRSFALDQDRGAAIRAPGRCDIYMGVGDAAGQRAGFTYSEGKLYYLFAKDGITTAEPLAAGEVDGGGRIEPDLGRRR
jgi:membrane-bound lytic murein transglycosylase A